MAVLMADFVENCDWGSVKEDDAEWELRWPDFFLTYLSECDKDSVMPTRLPTSCPCFAVNILQYAILPQIPYPGSVKLL